MVRVRTRVKVRISVRVGVYIMVSVPAVRSQLYWCPLNCNCTIDSFLFFRKWNQRSLIKWDTSRKKEPSSKTGKKDISSLIQITL